MYADLPLALRLEQAAAAVAQWSVTTHARLYPQSAAAWIPCGSGTAGFLDETSPLTQVKGAGMVAPTFESDLDQVEAFYEERMAPVTFVLSPFADAAIFTYLSRRGYEIGAFENTLFRPLSAADILDADPDVALAADADEWAQPLGEAFFDVVTPAALELCRTLHALPHTQSFVIRHDGQTLAGAQLCLHEGLALFQCDGTIRRYRRAGLQSKLIRERLSLAARAGCDVATADTEPGSASQRNYEKLGFRLAYTKVTLIKP
jgi:GNAT superfamily N-acetyltransferase